jgi:hypothetical protein
LRILTGFSRSGIVREGLLLMFEQEVTSLCGETYRPSESVHRRAGSEMVTIQTTSIMAFFHSETYTRWTSKLLAICWMVSMPLIASSATRAFNSGSYLLRSAFILCD